MTELEQRLINDFSRLAEQYEREQTQLAAQVNSLREQVEHLTAQCEQWMETTTKLAEDHHMMGAHITKLTDAYDTLTSDLGEFFR